jgi:alpha-glucoside transport system substrate-binding protein
VKANLKGLVWFRRSRVGSGDPAPPGWEPDAAAQAALVDRLGPGAWCIGVGSTGASGWPGTDWIEDLLLQRSGRNAYERWAAGRLAWTSPEVIDAWTAWLGVVSGPRGDDRTARSRAMFTDWADARVPIVDDRGPGCALEHQASFALDGYLDLLRPQLDGDPPSDLRTAAERRPDLDFFRYRAPGTRESPLPVSADLATMFNGTGEARRLMAFLAGRARTSWLATGRFSTAGLGADGERLIGRVGDLMAPPADAPATMCFDASDLMPPSVRDAFQRAVHESLADPAGLDALLRLLDQQPDWQALAAGPTPVPACAS